MSVIGRDPCDLDLSREDFVDQGVDGDLELSSNFLVSHFAKAAEEDRDRLSKHE